MPPRSAVALIAARQLLAIVVLLVHAVAVGRLDEQVVGLGDHRRIRQHGPVEAAEIAAEEDRLAAGAHARVRRPEQVTGVDEVDFDAVGDRHRPVVADRLQQRERAERVGFGVERQRRRVLRVAVAVGVLRVFFLNPARVGQHDAAEILGAGRAEDAAPEALRDEARQIAAVIEVRVRQHDGRDVRRA